MFVFVSGQDCIYQNGDEREKDFEEAERATAHQAPHQRQLLRCILVMLHRLGLVVHTLLCCHHRAGLSHTDCLDKKGVHKLKGVEKV